MCTPVSILDEGFTASPQWQQETSNGTTHPRKVYIVASQLTVSYTPSGWVTHQLSFEDPNNQLRYAFINENRDLLVFEPQPPNDLYEAWYKLWLVEFRDEGLEKHKLFESEGDSPPFVKRSAGPGGAFLVYASVPDTSSFHNVAVRRSDNGRALLSLIEPVSGPVSAEFSNPRISIRHGSSSTPESAVLWEVEVPDAVFTDPVPMNGSESILVMLENTGKDCLILESIVSESALWSVTTPDNPLPVSLSPGDELNVSVTFAPTPSSTEVGKEESFVVTVQTNPTTTSKFECKATSRARITQIGFNPYPEHDFGTIDVGPNATRELEFEIRNDGDDPLEVECGSPTEGSGFSWAPWQGSLPAAYPDNIRKLTITFTPDSASDFSDELSITSNAPGSPHKLELRGVGDIPNVEAPDLFLRDNLLDDGHEPLEGGGLSASPDVIVRNSPVTDPQAEFGSPMAMLRADLSDPVERGQDNYLYFRVTNRGELAGGGTIYAYWTRPTTLPSPDQWTPIDEDEDGEEKGISIPSVERDATTVVGPLIWPQDRIPEEGHYCFIALIDAPQDPAPNRESIASVSDFLNLIRSKNNAAWKNFNVVDAFPGTRQALEIHMGAWRNQTIRSDLKIDVEELPNDASVKLRVAKAAARKAARKGLTLVRETAQEYSFRVSTQQICALSGMSIDPANANRAILEIETKASTPKGRYRVSLSQEMFGHEMGRVSSLLSIGEYPYVGNSRTRELHVANCEWVQQMLPRRRTAFRSIDRAIRRGYNGCRFCLPKYNTG